MSDSTGECKLGQTFNSWEEVDKFKNELQAKHNWPLVYGECLKMETYNERVIFEILKSIFIKCYYMASAFIAGETAQWCEVGLQAQGDPVLTLWQALLSFQGTASQSKCFPSWVPVLHSRYVRAWFRQAGCESNGPWAQKPPDFSRPYWPLSTKEVFELMWPWLIYFKKKYFVLYRKLPAEAMELIDTAIETGGGNAFIRDEVRRKHGIYLKVKDIQNIKYSKTGHCFE